MPGSMYLCDLTFHGLGRIDGAHESAHRLAECLLRSGQFVGDVVVGVADPDLRVSGMLPLRTSLDDRFHTEYVRQELAVLRSMGGAPPRVTIHPQDPEREPAHLADLGDVDLLVLRTRSESLVSPLWHPSSDRHLPLHLVPLPADDLERIVMWERVQRALDRVWFHALTDGLELDAYRERARLDSAGVTEARDHARRIEGALGVPVYAWLERHYGAPEGDARRPCPACSGAWRAESDDAGGTWLRCDGCRLASHVAYTIDAEDWARFAPAS